MMMNFIICNQILVGCDAV